MIWQFFHSPWFLCYILSDILAFEVALYFVSNQYRGIDLITYILGIMTIPAEIAVLIKMIGDYPWYVIAITAIMPFIIAMILGSFLTWLYRPMTESDGWTKVFSIVSLLLMIGCFILV